MFREIRSIPCALCAPVSSSRFGLGWSCHSCCPDWGGADSPSQLPGVSYDQWARMLTLESGNRLFRLVVWMALPRSPHATAPSPGGGLGVRNGAGDGGKEPREPEEWFREVFETCVEPVLHLFVRRGIPRDSASDLTQETFLRVYRGFGRFRGEASLRTSIFHIAGNV